MFIVFTWEDLAVEAPGIGARVMVDMPGGGPGVAATGFAAAWNRKKMCCLVHL